MTIAPEVLIILFDALVIDDAEVICSLMRRFPWMRREAKALTDDERESLFFAEQMANHFYTYEHDGVVELGLVCVDNPSTRHLARECNLEDKIFWGPNADPVRVVTCFDIAKALEASDRYATPSRVLALLSASEGPALPAGGSDKVAAVKASLRLRACDEDGE